MAYRGTYKGKIDPKSLINPSKYVGDITNIVYRSSWERNVIYWIDKNPNVIEWASEEIVFPYEHPIENRRARYYPDFFIKMSDGKIRIIEVKPKKETSAPPKPKRRTKRYLNEVTTWVVNSEKWKSAEYYCKKNNMTFEIWTEETLADMGIQRQNNLGKNSPRTGKLKPTRQPRTRPTRKS